NNDLQVQTEKIGENVTIKCEQSFIKDNSYGKLPQLVVRLVSNNSNVRYNRQFIQRFNATLKGDQFVLNIQKTVEEDSGTYFCGRMKTDVTEFGSGTLLIFNGKSSVLIRYRSNWIVAALSIFSVISVILIVVLAVLLLKKQQKG
ncbi:hypothetical protein AMEX_G10934, partial [Astyanax mexicanus]